jgi:outer membrane protein assembly factor BamA
LKRVFGDTFLGLGVRYHDNQAEDFRGANVGAAAVLTDSTSVGITGHWLHDSRDHQDNPSKGWLLQFDYATFNESFASDTDFDQLEFRYSGYRPIDTFLNQRTATLAWQVQGHLSEGNVPWDRLTLLGGSRQLRGYEQGRYRGHQKVLAQVELRQPLTGRHGMVTWVGVGTLAEDISDLGEERWLPSIGVGYRLRIKEKINLRFDVGFGRSDKGVYVSVNEVF